MINIDNVVEFCKEELNIRDEVNVHVYLDDLLEEEGVKGWCHDDHLFSEEDELEYEIEIEESLDNDEMLVTLCHEMVHVKQYSDGYDANETEAYDLENELSEKYRSLLVV